MDEKDNGSQSDSEFNNINNSSEKNNNDEISMDSDNYSFNDDKYQYDKFNNSEKEQYKIASLFERLLKNKNNIKF